MKTSHMLEDFPPLGSHPIHGKQNQVSEESESFGSFRVGQTMFRDATLGETRFSALVCMADIKCRMFIAFGRWCF